MALACSLVQVTLAPVMAQAPQAGRIRGPLRVEGPRLVDRDGHEVQLCGVNLSGMEWGAGQPARRGKPTGPAGSYWPLRNVELDNTARWGFNVARIPIAWADLEPEPGHYNDAYLQELDRIVQHLRQKQVAVIFSMHQCFWGPSFRHTKRNGQTIHGNGMPPWLYPESWFSDNPVRHHAVTREQTGAAGEEFFLNPIREALGGQRIQERFIDVWRLVARRFKNDSNVVGADLLNEPCGNQHTPDSLEHFYQAVGRAVHEASPDLLLIFEPSISHPRIEHPHLIVDEPAFRGRAVYSAHIYSPNADAFLAKLKLQLARAQEWKVPLWIGEFHCPTLKDPSRAPFGFRVDRQQTSRVMDALRQNHVHWTYWAYSRDAQPLTLNDKINLELVSALQAGF